MRTQHVCAGRVPDPALCGYPNLARVGALARVIPDKAGGITFPRVATLGYSANGSRASRARAGVGLPASVRRPPFDSTEQQTAGSVLSNSDNSALAWPRLSLSCQSTARGNIQTTSVDLASVPRARGLCGPERLHQGELRRVARNSLGIATTVVRAGVRGVASLSLPLASRRFGAFRRPLLLINHTTRRAMSGGPLPDDAPEAGYDYDMIVIGGGSGGTCEHGRHSGARG